MGRLSPVYVLWQMLSSLSLPKRSPVNRQPSICDVLVTFVFFLFDGEHMKSSPEFIFLFFMTLWWLFSHLQQPFIWYFWLPWQFHANCLWSICRSWNTSANGPTYKQSLAFCMRAGYQHIFSCPQGWTTNSLAWEMLHGYSMEAGCVRLRSNARTFSQSRGIKSHLAGKLNRI